MTGEDLLKYLQGLTPAERALTVGTRDHFGELCEYDLPEVSWTYKPANGKAIIFRYVDIGPEPD